VPYFLGPRAYINTKPLGFARPRAGPDISCYGFEIANDIFIIASARGDVKLFLYRRSAFRAFKRAYAKPGFRGNWHVALWADSSAMLGGIVGIGALLGKLVVPGFHLFSLAGLVAIWRWM
jgi:hypothetical protein